MKVTFIKKPAGYELEPQDEFVIEKEIVLEAKQFDRFIKNPCDDYDFIKEHISLMRCDQKGVYHCIFVTSENHSFGVLIESEGYYYARYAAYIPKVLLV